MERCHRGGRSWEREKGTEMDWWRPERDRKWIYIHHSFCAPFDFWKGSRCASVHTAASIVAQWFTGFQMNMEQAQFATLAGSFPTERQSIRHFSTTLKRPREGWGWETEKRGPRDRMRNVMKATEWQRENEREWQSGDNNRRRTGCLWWVCFLTLVSPWFRGMLEIMWSSAWKRVSGKHGSCFVNGGPVFKRERMAELFIYVVISPTNSRCLRQRPQIPRCMETEQITSAARHYLASIRQMAK